MAYEINKTDATLHAFLDGQLSPDGRKKVQDFVKANAAKRQEMEQNLQVNDYLRKQFSPLVKQQLPSSITKLLQGTARPQSAANAVPAATSSAATNQSAETPGMEINLDEVDFGGVVEDEHHEEAKWRFVFHQTHDWHSHLLIITSAITFLLGLFIGYLYPTIMNSGNSNDQEILENMVVDTHVTFSREKQHIVEVAATEITHLTNWLSSKLELAVAPAILDKYGFHLAGGRLLPSNGENAAVYIYRKPDDSQLTLYIRNQTPLSGKKESACMEKTESIKLCNWESSGLR